MKLLKVKKFANGISIALEDHTKDGTFRVLFLDKSGAPYGRPKIRFTIPQGESEYHRQIARQIAQGWRSEP